MNFSKTPKGISEQRHNQRTYIMKSSIATIRFSPWRCAALLAIIIASMSNAFAQTPTSTPLAPQPSPTPSLERKFLKNILQDQRAIWTSQLHLHKEDAKWLASVGLSTAALIATDLRTADALDNNSTRLNVSHDISYVGSGYGAGSIAGAFYLIGRATHNARARETGLLGGEALIDSGIVAAVLKSSTQRPRPRAGRERGDFFDGGLSFPSGHTIAAWSLATVVANEYRDRRLMQISAYGLAAAVSVCRATQDATIFCLTCWLEALSVTASVAMFISSIMIPAWTGKTGRGRRLPDRSCSP